MSTSKMAVDMTKCANQPLSAWIKHVEKNYGLVVATECKRIIGETVVTQNPTLSQSDIDPSNVIKNALDNLLSNKT